MNKALEPGQSIKDFGKAELKLEFEEKPFKEKLKEWADKQAQINRQGFESNWAADTGRKHDDSQEGPRSDRTRTLATLRRLAQEARERKPKP